MNKDYINAMDAANEYGLYLKVVTSVKSFDTYNSFFNIFDQQDEPCRRIVMLTRDKQLEEVYDENPTEDVDSNKMIDDNIWIKSFSLLINPNKIELGDIVVSKILVEELCNK
ncbi:hypothetical protein [Clostridium uliginosum]|uniref:Uncharacterized protein n=1 Tax=Clostridium uliginosum TaxID=119641 RepID=A0A1I1I2K2_9CLOT|nr:hypothetical protein [Clostridium uliginosum]SFC27913.1 hypothetical protein SAMN05421842_10223 [Clostridium uliginosum]